MTSILARIEKRLIERANDAFDPINDIDSDGLDQAERDGILAALDIVREEFDRG